jgi:hypothetical protein
LVADIGRRIKLIGNATVGTLFIAYGMSRMGNQEWQKEWGSVKNEPIFIKRRIFNESYIIRAQMVDIITQALCFFSSISEAEKRVRISLEQNENKLINQDMNTLTRVGTAYMNQNYEEVVKIAAKLFMDRKNPQTKEHVNVFLEATKYYLDALFELDNRNELIEKALENAGEVSTPKPDIKIRYFRYELYKMIQNRDTREPFEWRDFGAQGIELEKLIFNTHKNIESREFRREALDYLEDINNRWIGFWRIYLENRDLDTSELDKESKTNINGNVIGYFTAFFLDDNDANNRRMILQQEQKNEEQIIPLRLIPPESIKQISSNIVSKKEQITRWKEEIASEGMRDNLRAIKRITTDDFMRLKNKKPADETYKTSLEDLNNDILQHVDED